MSKIQRTDLSALAEPSPPPALPIGDRVLEVLAVAYRARQPVLLEGPTGIGKSEIVGQFCARSGFDCRVLDLSLLEPPDLIGLPVIRDGQTHYAQPAELPTSGAGILLLEELNRAEIPVMQPALQLLSARRLHAYELPPDWICVAAINPEQDEYQVTRLDPALRSRFLQVPVVADRDAWLAWARRRNLHPVVLQLVENSADVFATSAPRSWTQLSRVLSELSPDETRSRDLVLSLAGGYLPTAWATAVAEAIERLPALQRLDREVLLGPEGQRYFADLIGGLRQDGRSDAITVLAWQVQNLLESDCDGLDEARLGQILAPLPGDLRARCIERLGSAESRKREP